MRSRSSFPHSILLRSFDHSGEYCFWRDGKRSALVALFCVCLGELSAAELHQDEVRYNFSAERGLPISDEFEGSNGLAPEVGSMEAPRESQWRTAVTFGQVLGRSIDGADYPSDVGDSADAGSVAKFVLKRAAIGAPYVVRSSSFLIGDVISVPEETEDGDPLPTGVSAEEYWFLEPQDPGRAYWSRHAESLFAVEPGSVNVVWIRREIEEGTPDDSDDTDKWLVLGSSYFRKYQKTYVVSGSANKTTRKLYWNSSPFGGPSIDLPSSRVGDLFFAYYDAFPENVDYEEDTDGDGEIDEDDTNGNGVIDDDVDPRLSKNSDFFQRTIWLEQLGLTSQIRAQNVEGRIFMEILGDVVSSDDEGDVREHLGFEIIDVIKYATPSDWPVELGNEITPASGRDDLFPLPIDVLTSSDFYYQHAVGEDANSTLYAVKETENANDLLIYWLQEGLEGILWPLEFVRYQLVWPADMSKYSHYVRPPVATEDEAKLSAVPLNAEDVPFIVYQDGADEVRAKLTEDTRFYTFLDSGVPEHRSLLRFISDDNVAFERVYSWLDEGLLLDLEGESLSEKNSSLDESSLLVVNLKSDSGSILEPFEFDTESFTIEAQVTLNSRGESDYLLQLTVKEEDSSLATVDLGISLSLEQPFPFMDVYGEVLPDAETENFNGELANGGLRYRADVMPVKAGHDDLTEWQAMIIGSEASDVAVNGSEDHYGVLFRGDGLIEVWDGLERDITDLQPEDVFYADDSDHSGVFHRVNVLASGEDGNPFDGAGSSIIDVYSSISSSAIHSYEKGIPGYSDNLFGTQSIGDGELKNLQVTRISDGTGFAEGTTEFPVAQRVLLTMVGEGEDFRIYLDGVLVGEGPNLVGVSGTVVSALTGVEMGSDLEIESLRIWTQESGDSAPRIVYEEVEVGERIVAPVGEEGSEEGSDYLAGFINQNIGTSFSATAYVNPLDINNGIDLANRGAIIPINAIPGDNVLEVWWLRPNGADADEGFSTIFWPSAMGRYTINWPSDPREIVLASNRGSTGESDDGLSSFEKQGAIYTQNIRSEAGYNPNEEHALMSAGVVYALRDDLNIASGSNFSSEPYVLLEFEDEDGRPSMSPFHVIREKPETGETFKFDREAGIVLQAPMPLPLLANPIPENADESLNSESGVQSVKDTELGGAAGEVVLTTFGEHRVVPFNIYTVQSEDLVNSSWIYIDSVDYGESTVGGFVSSILPVPLSVWELTAPGDPTTTLRLQIDDLGSLQAGDSVRLVSEASRATVAIDISDIGTEDSVNYIDLPIGEADQADYELLLVLLVPDASAATDGFNDWTLRRSPAPANVLSEQREFYAGFTRQDRKGNVWIYRGPHSDADAPAMDMHFYYPTQDGFWFPELDEDGSDQPEVGTLTPYLRIETAEGTYQGEGVFALDQETGEPLSQALPIAYRPFWPDEIPVMKMAQTLTTTINGLPAIQGNSSLELIYEQSQIDGQQTALLHDSTREKEYYLGETNEVGGVEFYLEEIPASVETTTYNGDVLFPGLPPHIESRFFMDPNRGADGALVFRGEHREETVGEDYLLLNVLSVTDLATLQGLVPSDEDETIKENWDFAIENLTAAVDLFIEDPAVPGTHVSVASIKERLDSIETESPDDVYYDESLDLTEIGLAAEEAILGLDDYHFGIDRLGQDLVTIVDDDEAVDSYSLTAMGPGSGYVSLIAGDGEAFTASGDPVSILIIQVDADLHPGELKVILSDSPLAEKVTVQQTVDLASMTDLYDVEWMVGAPVDGVYPALDRSSDNPGSGWIDLASEKYADKIRSIVGDTADVQSLSDQYLIMRYRANANTHASWVDDGVDLTENLNWSEWTDPEAGGFVEGWIKRVLAGINPFNQRTTDLFNNAVDTDGSMLTLVGPRWEGDIALNSDTINDYGLIEIYETVLNRGRGLSIDADINYGPANDALLLAASYINDLYMFVGNEAYADALNPTIGIGTADGALGDVATALFAFKGQTASLLEEELALLRGRDDFLPPGVEATPVYNRLFWNYTRGIDSGEVIYAQNYNIQEDNNSDFDGVIDAEDAAVMFPQGHGDAYGHYLTAMKGYYSLLSDTDFEWVPRTEAVTILGQTVQVDYTDERKFAAAAASVAETGKNVLELTWRQDYETGSDVGWEHFGAEAVRENTSKETSRYWGVDHWASRTGQGAFVNWVAGNAMLPDVDDDPTHEGIQVIDRTTVPELEQIADLGADIQASMDSADAHLNPLGLADDSVAFDINPHAGLALGGETHFEQILERAKTALNNAVVAFDDAKGVTQQMRSETDSLAELQADVESQETAYDSALIEIYGTPYADDIGVGQTYETGYEGADFLHYMYVDKNEFTSPLVTPEESMTFAVDIQDYTSDFQSGDKTAIEFILKNLPAGADDGFEDGVNHISYTLDSHGFFEKPDSWTGRRESPGKLQSAISDIVKARNAASQAFREHETVKYELDRMLEVADAQGERGDVIGAFEEDIFIAESFLNFATYANDLYDLASEHLEEKVEDVADAASAALPETVIVGFGLASAIVGFDPSAPVDAGVQAVKTGTSSLLDALDFAREAAFGAYEMGLNETIRFKEFYEIGGLEGEIEDLAAVYEVDMKLREVQMSIHQINEAVQRLADAQSAYQKLLADGNRIQSEREVFRRRAAALTQGFRTRDAAFRIFRDEKLERYQSLFGLAAQYAFLAAKAFDYETGLLHTDQGLDFINRIVESRALGVVTDGEPQFAGSETGDPGLSSALAEMAAEWQVLKGRLGLNNPDVYGTTVSLRTEHFRINPGSTGDVEWRDELFEARTANVLEDDDVLRHCMQIDLGDGLPVPGIILEFSTEITSGNNLFGQPLAGGDHAFDVSSFATKIFSVGIVLEGYNGMDNPSSNVSVTDGSSVADPTAAFLDTTMLSATPTVYLIPAGLDAMRSPPLGDQSVIRTWSVEDVTIPMPFNIGGSDFSTKKLYQSTDSLSEELFSVRKHQAFRPVSDADVFEANASLLPSVFTNNRLIGRSVWNTRWKLVIPGRSLLNNSEQGLDVLIDALDDIRIHFETYSYSGN